MDMPVICKGFIIGFGMAIPVGPLAIICIRRTLSSNHQYGLLTALGAATGDAIFASVTVLGLSFVSTILTTYQTSIRIIGGCFLVSLGIKSFYSDLTSRHTAPQPYGFLGTYITALLLTLANPITILMFATAISSLGPVEPNSFGILIMGVFLGSATWFSSLSFGAKLLKSQLGSNLISDINKLSGILIAICGLIVMLYGVIHH
jgi:threonine/homoserine/homoserine lactone efflux protein